MSQNSIMASELDNDMDTSSLYHLSLSTTLRSTTRQSLELPIHEEFNLLTRIQMLPV